MKLHTKLSISEIYLALACVKESERVAESVTFVQFEPHGSRTHPNGYEIQLGSYEQRRPDGKSRHYKNSGQYGADRVWAATYDEWGWLMREIFDRDPAAMWGNRTHGYKGVADFHAKTKGAFK